ncbi:MAG TPA: ABC transporter substrate-binding protein, partial [Polyangiaceae bacterium]|nr:ABC transporter substrate-binding protein [Polyangiaceae bacterium]
MRAPGWNLAVFLSIAPITVALLSACGGARHAARADLSDDSRPIEMLVANDPETLDPRYATDAVGLRATRLVHAGLVRLDPDTLAPRPYLASAWQWLDPLTLRVEVRKDVRFHSGAPLRSRDVVETLRAIASPRVASRLARIVELIGEAREDGDHAVVIRLVRPHATLLTDLELPILRADEALSPPATEGSLDGLGPYAIVSAARGEVRLSPASGGALPRPAHAVILRTVHDENARVLRLESGRSDASVNLLSPALLPVLARQPGLGVHARPGANLTYIVVQEMRTPFGDSRVRQAISRAVDRPMLTATLFGGTAHPATGLIPPANWAHSEAPPFAFEPGKARALLAEAGALGLHVTLLTSTERLRIDVSRVI